MADFNYIASGSLTLKKCGFWYSESPIYTRNIAFSVRDQAWLRYRAERGILESIVIKKIRLVDFTYRGGGEAFITYVDTFNALYNESDLIYYEEAVAIVQAYLYRKLLSEEAAECMK